MKHTRKLSNRQRPAWHRRRGVERLAEGHRRGTGGKSDRAGLGRRHNCRRA